MFLRYFEAARTQDRALLVAGSGQRSDAAVHQRGHEPVQGRLPRHENATTRAPTSQKCVRAGGKHNDLENVGFTIATTPSSRCSAILVSATTSRRTPSPSRGSWSPKGVELHPERQALRHHFKREEGIARDDEAYEHWRADCRKSIGVPRIESTARQKDNFWAMGPTGPCGPCSELHYDRTRSLGEGHADCEFGCECGAYVEIWNLVFMQFDRERDGDAARRCPSRRSIPAQASSASPPRCRGRSRNYDTDLFLPLIKRAAELTGASLETELKKEDEEERHHQAASLRVIADHARASTFLISDGVVPANEGRGDVLRKIIRRAIRHGRLLGQKNRFLFEMVFAVRDLMKDAYPELNERRRSRRGDDQGRGDAVCAHAASEGLKILERGT